MGTRNCVLWTCDSCGKEERFDVVQIHMGSAAFRQTGWLTYFVEGCLPGGTRKKAVCSYECLLKQYAESKGEPDGA